MATRTCSQCIATTVSTRKRCVRKTCKYSKYCSQHTKMYSHLQINPSTIPGAGDGLFTLVDIPKKKFICRYAGKEMSLQEYLQKNSGYGVLIKKDRIIDGADTQSALGRYANSCQKKDGMHCKGANAKFSVSAKNKTISLVSTKKIKAGEEIFVAYGGAYWK